MQPYECYTYPPMK